METTVVSRKSREKFDIIKTTTFSLFFQRISSFKKEKKRGSYFIYSIYNKNCLEGWSATRNFCILDSDTNMKSGKRKQSQEIIIITCTQIVEKSKFNFLKNIDFLYTTASHGITASN